MILAGFLTDGGPTVMLVLAVAAVAAAGTCAMAFLHVFAHRRFPAPAWVLGPALLIGAGELVGMFGVTTSTATDAVGAAKTYSITLIGPVLASALAVPIAAVGALVLAVVAYMRPDGTATPTKRHAITTVTIGSVLVLAVSAVGAAIGAGLPGSLVVGGTGAAVATLAATAWRHGDNPTEAITTRAAVGLLAALGCYAAARSLSLFGAFTAYNAAGSLPIQSDIVAAGLHQASSVGVVGWAAGAAMICATIAALRPLTTDGAKVPHLTAVMLIGVVALPLIATASRARAATDLRAQTPLASAWWLASAQTIDDSSGNKASSPREANASSTPPASTSSASLARPTWS